MHILFFHPTPPSCPPFLFSDYIILLCDSSILKKPISSVSTHTQDHDRDILMPEKKWKRAKKPFCFCMLNVKISLFLSLSRSFLVSSPEAWVYYILAAAGVGLLRKSEDLHMAMTTVGARNDTLFKRQNNHSPEICLHDRARRASLTCMIWWNLLPRVGQLALVSQHGELRGSQIQLQPLRRMSTLGEMIIPSRVCPDRGFETPWASFQSTHPGCLICRKFSVQSWKKKMIWQGNWRSHKKIISQLRSQEEGLWWQPLHEQCKQWIRSSVVMHWRGTYSDIFQGFFGEGFWTWDKQFNGSDLQELCEILFFPIVKLLQSRVLPQNAFSTRTGQIQLSQKTILLSQIQYLHKYPIFRSSPRCPDPQILPHVACVEETSFCAQISASHAHIMLYASLPCCKSDMKLFLIYLWGFPSCERDTRTHT